MASNINFHLNGGLTPVTGRQRFESSRPEEVGLPSDGYTPGLQQPVANEAAPETRSVTLTMSAEQLGTQAFRQTLAVLSASGYQVTVALTDPQKPKPVHSESEDGIIARPKPKPKAVSYWDTHDLRNGW